MFKENDKEVIDHIKGNLIHTFLMNMKMIKSHNHKSNTKKILPCVHLISFPLSINSYKVPSFWLDDIDM